MIAVPPSVADQAENVYPARVGAVGAEEILAAVFTEPLLTVVPPLELYVTVREFAVHCAYKVIDPYGEAGV